MSKRTDFLNTFSNILINEKIEIVKLINNDLYLFSFIFHNIQIFIDKNGKVLYENLNKNEEEYIFSLILQAQEESDIETKCPITNIDYQCLDKVTLGSIDFLLLIQHKNICFLFRSVGVFGFEYVVCEKTVINESIVYVKCNYIDNIIEAEYAICSRANMNIEFTSLFTIDELISAINFIKHGKINKHYSEKIPNFNNNLKTFIKKSINLINMGEES